MQTACKQIIVEKTLIIPHNLSLSTENKTFFHGTQCIVFIIKWIRRKMKNCHKLYVCKLLSVLLFNFQFQYKEINMNDIQCRYQQT